MTTRRLAAVLGLLALLLASSANADLEAVERRLKAVGIDPALQARIQRSIDRAVVYLRRHQRRDGGFGGDGARGLGRAALCSFALRHAGTPAAMEGVERAREYLFPAGRRTWSTLLGDVYASGLALLFLNADRPHTEEHGERHVKRLMKALTDAQDERSGWWHYYTPLFRPTGPNDGNRLVNLSTTQFAALGLWAGQPFITLRPTPVWRRHLASILELCTPGGSWPYEPVRWDKGKAYKWGRPAYPTATYMGLASLVLAEAALGPEDLIVERTAAERADVRARALGALRRQAPWTLRGHSVWPFYSLYALEKACVFLGLERIEGLEWYREGATRLVEFQGEDGGWNRRAWQSGVPDAGQGSELEGSALALLFLLRTSETLRPITPSEVDAPDRVVTESEAPTEETPSEPEPEPETGVRLSDARVALATLRERIRDSRATNDEQLEALDAVAEAYRTLVPDPGTEKLFEALAIRWRTEAEDVLLDTLSLVKRRRGKGNEREPVTRRAAEILAGANRRISERLRRIVDERLVKTDASAAVLGACFHALATFNDPASATWLAETYLDTDQRMERRHRTERALRALAHFQDLPGDVRFDATERILRTFEGVEVAASAAQFGDLKPQANFGTWHYWEHIRYDAVFALHALARDPRSGEIPRTERGLPALGMKAVRTWLSDHKRPARAPWYVGR